MKQNDVNVKTVRMGPCDRGVFNDRVHTDQWTRSNQGKEVAMKFIMTVLAIRFIAELIGNKRKNINVNVKDQKDETVRHPAEYGLR